MFARWPNASRTDTHERSRRDVIIETRMNGRPNHANDRRVHLEGFYDNLVVVISGRSW